MKTTDRSIHLDGLRGIASLMVFLNHLALSVLPSVSTLTLDASGIMAFIKIGYSPLSVIWGGDFGVCIFFVLSGYVLSQFCCTTNFSFPAMLIRRYLRLALPMVFSTVLAVVMLKAGVFQNKSAANIVSHSSWFALWYQMSANFWIAIKEGLLTAFTEGHSAYNSNLWTMRFELIGSIAIFMSYTLLSKKKLRILVLAIAICTLPSYFPLFAVGSLLFELLSSNPIKVNSNHFYPWIEISAIILFAAGIFAGGFPASGNHSGISSPWHNWLIKSDNAQAWHMWGATFIMAGILRSKYIATFFNSNICQFLGKISFPLYLIQILILCSVTSFIMTALKDMNYLVLASISMMMTIVVSITLAYFISIHVDARTLMISRNVGKYIDHAWKQFSNATYTNLVTTFVVLLHHIDQYSIGKRALEIIRSLINRLIKKQSPLIKIFTSQLNTNELENSSIDYFQNSNFHHAKLALECAAKIGTLSPDACCRLALTHLITQNEKHGVKWLAKAANADSFYRNSDLDIARDSFANINMRENVNPDELLYAGYNLAAMRAYQVGSGELSTSLAAAALIKQAKIKPQIQPSAEITTFLAENNLKLDDVQIFPATWVSQIGHIGMLDIMLRMRHRGWWSGTAIVLAPNGHVANDFFLSIIAEHHDAIIIRDDTHTQRLHDFISLTRSHGLPYHVFQPPRMPYVRWHEAAALAMQQTCDEHSLTLSSICDQRFANDPKLNDELQSAMAAWDIKDNDWFVCLHLREPGYHDAASVDFGQANRNAALDNYLGAIEFIVSKGGRVIKMGSKKSPVSPNIPGLIDYAHSDFKSKALDIALIRNARYFIGTTSGLANVAISLGIPTAQVNCITTEFQPWGSSVRFCLKPIKRKNGTLITQRELSSNDRWALATAQTMSAAGLTAEDNSSDEILATVQEVDALATDKHTKINPIISIWRKHLSVAHAYGAALPSSYFLHKYADTFLNEKVITT